ncbi:hypothetical protein NHX12_020641 [Muraenolepis orangiensis]|uniref:Uncharacterized protein n=1 Tax=Muraenolepis orangiensis TaxID=630683 RepID=A0A9Q0EVA0_9TELE|nr:hypothetical protein NHX12_020641 [Muraenolepis orangiensis]
MSLLLTHNAHTTPPSGGGGGDEPQHEPTTYAQRPSSLPPSPVQSDTVERALATPILTLRANFIHGSFLGEIPSFSSTQHNTRDGAGMLSDGGGRRMRKEGRDGDEMNMEEEEEEVQTCFWGRMEKVGGARTCRMEDGEVSGTA